MKVGIISDTHGYLDPQVCEHFADCDQIWHAGDFGKHEVIDGLRDVSELLGVYGNIDDGMVRNEFPEHLRIDCEGVRVLMIHIAGRPSRFNKTVRELLDEERPHILLCGHSHILQAERDESRGGILCLNPGAAGHEGFHITRTIMVGEFEKGQVTKMDVIELGPRGRKKSSGGRKKPKLGK